MSLLQWLGLILFVALLYKCTQPIAAKWRRHQAGEHGALADLGFSIIACGFCLWAIIAIFFFPG